MKQEVRNFFLSNCWGIVQRHSSKLGNELINIFRNASIGTTVKEDESWWELQLLLAFGPPNLIHPQQLSLTLSWSKPLRGLMRVVWSVTGNIQSTLMQLLFLFDRGMRVEEILIQTLACHFFYILTRVSFMYLFCDITWWLPGHTLHIKKANREPHGQQMSDVVIHCI
jgi:hypothetical protein